MTTHNISGHAYNAPDKLTMGLKLTMSSILMSKFGRQTGFTIEELNSDVPEIRAEVNRQFEEWGTEWLLHPTVFYPMIDAAFKPTNGAPALSVLCETSEELTDEEQTLIMERVIFFIRNAIDSMSGPKQFTNALPNTVNHRIVDAI